eukprot:Lankesteria_metandrocarpae@DN5441_c0_g1_i1.p1
MATRLGLKLTEESKSFKGLGEAVGKLTESVPIVFSDSSVVDIAFYVVNGDLPVVLGLELLMKINAVVDCAAGVVRRGTTSISLPVEDALWKQELQQNKPAYKGESDITVEDRMAKLKCGSDEHREQLVRLLYAMSACWVSPQIGKCKVVERSFVVNGPPRKTAVIPLSDERRAEMRRQIHALLERGVIVPSKSPWAAAAFFVSKKTGDQRMVMDYRPLNKQMESDSYPLPLLWNTVQRMAGKQYYSTLDLAAGFWNCPISEESRKYTAFLCELGQFEYTVLPFGIKNSPAEMQRAVDMVFQSLISTGKVFAYIDDIGIATDTITEHFELLEQILRLCTENGLWIQLHKCRFFYKSLVYLGFQVSALGIQPDSKRVDALLAMKSPLNKKELQRVMGSLSYLRRFMPDFATKTALLSDQLVKGRQFNWTDECERVFRETITELATYVLLTAPVAGGNYIIMTDASDIGLGAVLLQRRTEDIVVLEFASRKLALAERNWSVRDREATAIKFACLKFHRYIDGFKTVVVTDCQSLTFLRNADTGRVHRLWLFLQRYDLCIVHWSGEMNVLADWLSRDSSLTNEENDEIDEMSLALCAIDTPDSYFMQSCRLPSISELLLAYEQCDDDVLRDTYVGVDSLRYSTRGDKIFIPLDLRSAVIYWFHCGKYGGHYGINSTWRRM